MDKEILVVVSQEGSDYSFKMKSNRVPKLGEYVAEQGVVFLVENVMTFRKMDVGYPVVLVKRVDPDRDMERILNELDSKFW